jgi:prevent-host-death family protein
MNNNNIWQLQDAKSKFSQLVEKAMHNKPQFVTKHGNNAVVILSFEEYKKIIKPKKDLISFFRCSPFLDFELEIIRVKDFPRDIEL